MWHAKMLSSVSRSVEPLYKRQYGMRGTHMVGQPPSSITWTSFVTDMLPRTIGYRGQNTLEFWSAVLLVTGSLTLNAVLLADNWS